ncbi:type VI toxin-antitoxin system SocB family DNA replication inhibitor toxin [Rhizobium sp. A37_96]
MKTRRLAETDLARIAVLPVADQWVLLRKHKFGRPPHTYDPVRRAQPDILNRQIPLFGRAEPTPWQKVCEIIQKHSRHTAEYEHNLSVAKALYDFAQHERVFSRDRLMPNWAIGFGQSVRFWADYISIVGEQPEVSFHDYRLTKRLNKEARRFAFSVMHERTRALDPDLQNVALAIYQFRKLDDGTRILQRRTDDGLELFSFDQLNEMISTTYRIWEQILIEREEDDRRAANSNSNPMRF